MGKPVGFDVLEHVKERYAGRLGFAELQQPYPDRIVGTRGSDHVVILVKPVGPEHASTYRRWVTYGKGDFDGMLAGRPTGWAYYVLMVGLLPDGSPWWSAIYDEADLRAKAGFAEPMRGGRFYRWDPGLVEPEGQFDFTEAEDVKRDPMSVAFVYRCPRCGLLADFEPTDDALTQCPVCGTDEPLFVYERTYPPMRDIPVA